MAYESVKQVVEEFAISKKAFEERMQNAFKEIFETFFRLYPEIQAVGWNQYTPYFNDGDTCEFGVGDMYLVEKDVDISDVNNAYDLGEFNFSYNKPSVYAYNSNNIDRKEQIRKYEENKETNPRFYEVAEGCDELLQLLRLIPEEIYLSTFEDHVFVLATRDGIKVEEYDHD